MKSIVIVGDSSFVIETIRLALRNSAGLRILGKLDGRESVRGSIAEHRPDIVLVDEMQASDEALERIRAPQQKLGEHGSPRSPNTPP